MRLAFLSDLHIDRNPAMQVTDYLHACLSFCEREEIDMFVLGGDISNTYQLTQQFVRDLEQLAGIPVFYIPGNHDFWQKKDEAKHTWDIYERYVQDQHSLLKQPITLNEEWALVGHPAWYNYAVYNRARFTLAEIERGRFKLATWQDRLRLDFRQSDPEVSQYFKEELTTDIQKVHDKQIILVNHMVTIPEFTVPMPHRAFDYFNAFIATDDLDDLFVEYAIAYNFMGHVHFRGELQKKDTLYVANSLGYPKEWRKGSLLADIKDAAYIIEL